jgi:acyl-CoA reductase-like NAD-dependent aldehyde dehydrogenase
MEWTDEEDVIRRANDTNTGLGACVWAKDEDRAIRIGSQMEAGSVWINSFEKPTARACMGGHKESGIGSEGGTVGLMAYCNPQVMHIHK